MQRSADLSSCVIHSSQYHCTCVDDSHLNHTLMPLVCDDVDASGRNMCRKFILQSTVTHPHPSLLSSDSTRPQSSATSIIATMEPQANPATSTSSTATNAASSSASVLRASAASSTNSFPARRTPPMRRGVPPSAGQFWRAGIPFIAFMVLAPWGYSKLLAAQMGDESGAQSRLYGKRIEGEDYDELMGKKDGKEMNKSKGKGKSTKPGFRSLEEEYAILRAQAELPYENKRVPRPKGLEDAASHAATSRQRGSQ